VKSAGLAPSVADQVPAVHNMEHGVFKEFRRFPDMGAWQSASKVQDFDWNEPYIIESCPQLAAACNEKHVRTPLSVFKVQFPGSDQGRDNGRGQIPFQNDSRKKIREMMIDMAPRPCSGVQIPESQLESIAAKAITAVSLFGCCSQMVWEGMERNTLPSMRYQCAGTRQLCAIAISDVIEFAADDGCTPADKEPFLEFVKRVVVQMTTSENFDTFASNGTHKILRGIIKPGSYVYLPLGTFVAERTVGADIVLGFRTSIVDPSAKNMLGWNSMYDMMLAHEGADNPMVKSFAKFSELMKSVAVTVPAVAAPKEAVAK
jgi:hypothetical protein